jgi:hypothetical protein
MMPDFENCDTASSAGMTDRDYTTVDRSINENISATRQ